MRVLLLGPLEVVVDGRAARLGGPREQAVVALLALQPSQAITIERIIDGLWGDRPPKSATKTVQTYVSRLRREIGDRLRTAGSGYALQVDATAVDALAFADATTVGRRLLEEGAPRRALDQLEEALTWWRGDPLSGLAFSEPLAAEATRLQELRVQAQESAARARLALGGHEEVVTDVAALLAEHPLREQLWHDLILALYRSGRQADALRAFQRARQRLVEELGIEPGAELRSLESRILAQDETLLGAAAGATQVGQRPGRALPAPLTAMLGMDFVGRDDDLRALDLAWSRVREGALSIQLLAGEPGIGKSLLAAQAAARWAADGATVLYGRCDEEQLVPYQPFVSALRHFVREHAADHGRLAAAAGEAIRLLPELRDPNDVGAASFPADGPDRLAVFDGITALVRAATCDGPLVVVLDDLHWADPSTLLLLRHLVGSGDDLPVLLLVTYRDTELRRDHPLGDTLGILRRDARVGRRLLRGLTAEQTLDLMRRRGTSADEITSTAELVHQETGGNPLFVSEVLLHLDETGWQADGTRVPEGVREVIGRRLARLDAGANELLCFAALAGQHFAVPVVARAAGVAEAEAIEHLEDVRRAGLLVEDGPAGYRYAFAHAIVRATVHEELGASRRVRVHRALADAHESLGGDASARCAAIAHHLIEAAQATDAPRAAAYARRAGLVALEQLAFEDAADHFRRALDVLELAPAAARELRGPVLLDLGRALAPVDHGAAMASWWEAARAAEERADLPLLAASATELVGVRPRGTTTEPEVQLLQRVITELSSEEHAPELVRAQARLAIALSSLDDRDTLLESTGRAIAAGRKVDDRAVLCEALVSRLFTLTLPTDADERLALSVELLRHARGAGASSYLVHAHRFRATALLERGEVAEAWSEAERHRELAERRRDLPQVELGLNLAASRATAEGRFEDADAVLADLVPLHERAGLAAMTETVLHSHRIVRAWLLGHPFDLFPPPMPEPSFTAAMAAVHALSGRPDLARSALTDLRARASSVPANWGWGGVVFLLAVAAAASGDVPLRGWVLDQLDPHAGRWLSMSGRAFFGAVDHQRALLLAADDSAAADAMLRRSAAEYTDRGLAAWAARAQADVARLGA